MSKKSVFCIATSRDRAELIVDQLRTANFTNKDLSVLRLEEGSLGASGDENTRAVPESTVGSEGTGGAVDSILRWVAGAGILAVPGVGCCVGAGPAIAALRRDMLATTDASIAASLVGLGIPEFEAKQYENRIKDGNILLAVHIEHLGDLARAKDIFAQYRAENFCTIDVPPSKEQPPGQDHPETAPFPLA